MATATAARKTHRHTLTTRSNPEFTDAGACRGTSLRGLQGFVIE
jgi:hypothetical protein